MFFKSRRNIPALATAIPENLLAIVARIAVASVFWRSVQTKISGWEFINQSWNVFHIKASTFMLFQYEYALPVIPYRVAAYAATFSEFFFSLAILLGLYTRLSASALFAMTLVIEIFVYPEAWPTHILWAIALLYLIKHGPGTFSLDQYRWRRQA